MISNAFQNLHAPKMHAEIVKGEIPDALPALGTGEHAYTEKTGFEGSIGMMRKNSLRTCVVMYF